MLYKVIRPEDGMVVPLTCTAEQLKIWKKDGYKLAPDRAEIGSIIVPDTQEDTPNADNSPTKE